MDNRTAAPEVEYGFASTAEAAPPSGPSGA